MLSSLLEGILFQSMLKLRHLLVYIFQLLPVHLNLVVQPIVFAFQLFILITLLRVQIIKSRLICIVYVLDLLLIRRELVFHIFLLGKETV